MSGQVMAPASGGPAVDDRLETVLQEAVDAVLETCSLQLDRHYAPLPDFASTAPGESPWVASSIELPAGSGRWQLVVAGEREAVAELARTMFDLECGEPVTSEDAADALNEVVNVAAGVLKSYRADAGEHLAIELPFFHADPGELLDHPHHQQLLDRYGHHLRVLVRWFEGEDS